MTDQQLLELFDDLESDLVERKQSASDRSKIRQAICAYANDLPDHRWPGVIFVGAAADGALGAHTYAVSDAYNDFKNIAERIAAGAGIENIT